MRRSNLARSGHLAVVLALVTALFLVGGTAPARADDRPETTTALTTPTDVLLPVFEGQWRDSDGERRSSTQGSTATVRFRGTGVQLWGGLGPSQGRVAVQLDGGPVTWVDQYADERSSDVVFYSSPALADGDHVIVLTVTGSGRSASSGDTVRISRATVTTGSSDVSGPSVSSTVNDGTTGDGLEQFDFDGHWTRSDGAGKHGQDDHWAERAGSSLTFRFRGVGVALHGATAPHHGMARVTVDGGPSVVVDQYSQQRRDGALLFDSGPLPDGEHVVVLEVLGRHAAASSEDVVAVDHAVVRRVAQGGGGLDDGRRDGADRTSAWRETGEGRSMRGYASTSTNDDHDLWHVESGSEAVDRSSGSILKTSNDRFHRMFSTERFGGPGSTLRISYRARATAIRERSGSDVVEGAKIGLKWPVSPSLTGYSKDDPRSVYGNSSQTDASGPGSYAFVTGLTRDGYMELARNGYGGEGYTFFRNKRIGYSPGTWKDVVVEVVWQDDRSIRVRYWHDADADGAPVYEATDDDSPFWHEPGFLWLRTDDTDWEYDHITIECSGRC